MGSTRELLSASVSSSVLKEKSILTFELEGEAASPLT